MKRFLRKSDVLFIALSLGLLLALLLLIDPYHLAMKVEYFGF